MLEKFVSTGFFLVVLFNVSFGQFDIGPLVGFDVYKPFPKAKNSEEYYERFSNRIQFGLMAGGYFNYHITDKIGIATAVYYSLKGKTTDIEGVRWSNISRYNFVEAPLLFRYTWGQSMYAGIPYRPYFNFGPNVSYWMSGRGKLEGGATLNYKIVFDEPSYDIYTMSLRDVNRWIWGLDIGGGMEITVYDVQKLFLDFRIGIGHTFLGEPDSVNPNSINILGFDDDLKVHYRTFMVTVAYTFEIDFLKMRKGKSTIK